MTGGTKGNLGSEFLTRLKTDKDLVRALKLGKTYEARLAEALADAKMAKYLEDGLNTIFGVGVPNDLPEGVGPDDALLLSAAAVIKGGLVEKARWDARNPGKPFPGEV